MHLEWELFTYKCVFSKFGRMNDGNLILTTKYVYELSVLMGMLVLYCLVSGE